MSCTLVIWRFQLHLVIGRVYVVSVDAFQRTCLRMAWRGKPVLRLGPTCGA